ncbi:uncharacterized protein F4822DRAFT_442122 [Hypoxylon trugodes]|uniref:uncharacterized protein n=1 Tax=Hypoxylon trugodes TaxID=326681 RepID=UPI0021A0141B|nr:uncharacterized protein F4822DRAFT_442122 [Hypoxylon trugodes]KAI1390882.1 hypothetical protein F4822DRAFT_442122 [Hypoxylon trugodes]
MDISGTSCGRFAKELDAIDERIVLNVMVMDDGASLETLNSFRRQLGLGPSKNLISSGKPVSTPTPAGDCSNSDGCQHQPAENNDLTRTPHGGSVAESSPDQLHTPDAYQGNRALSRNRAADIPDDVNCRLWITGLPPHCTVQDLLQVIRGVGPIYATHIVPPSINETAPESSIHTSAASLTFFTVADTEKFLSKYHPFVVQGYSTTVIRHRIKTRPLEINGQSRVLVIKGPPAIVNPDHLNRAFTQLWNVRFNTDFIEHRPGKESSEIVWGFGSFRAQAQAGYVLLNRHFSGRVVVQYGDDPCA